MSLNTCLSSQFSNPSGIGGKIVTAIMNRRNYPMYEETERLLSSRAADRILDIGCGNGYVPAMLARRYDCVYTGIDISESALQSAAKRNRKHVKNGGMSFTLGSAGKIPFADAAFDKAYTINTVYF